MRLILRHTQIFCKWTLHCNALITGGWDRGDDDTGHYGVHLDLVK